MGHGLVWGKPLPGTTPPQALLSTLGPEGPTHPRLQMAMGGKQGRALPAWREQAHTLIPHETGWRVAYDQPVLISWEGGDPTQSSRAAEGPQRGPCEPPHAGPGVMTTKTVPATGAEA